MRPETAASSRGSSITAASTARSDSSLCGKPRLGVKTSSTRSSSAPPEAAHLTASARAARLPPASRPWYPPPARMSLSRLKWLTALGLVGFVLVLDLVRTSLSTQVEDTGMRLLMGALVILGAAFLLGLVFHFIGRLH